MLIQICIIGLLLKIMIKERVIKYTTHFLGETEFTEDDETQNIKIEIFYLAGGSK